MQALAHSSELSDADFKTVHPTNIEVVNDSTTPTDLRSVISAITVTVADIDITHVISKISDLLADKMNSFTRNIPEVGYNNDDRQMLEATSKVLTSVCSDIIRSVVQNRISQTLCFDLRKIAMLSLSTIYMKLSNRLVEDCIRKSIFENSSKSKYSKIVSENKSPVLKGTRDLLMRSNTFTDSRLFSESYNRAVIIMDVDRDIIFTCSSPENFETIHLVYNPPCREFPGGHYDVCIDGKRVQVTLKKTNQYENEDAEEDDTMWWSAVATAFDLSSFIPVKQTVKNPFYRNENSRRSELLTSDHFTCQLKHGRAFFRSNKYHSNIQIDQSEHVQCDSSHLLSCIKQALKSKRVSHLAKILKRHESKSESGGKQETAEWTSLVSRDACKLFLSSGRSSEAEVYRQLVVKIINDGDITTALQLCCIGHQMPFGRNIMDTISSASDHQTFRDTFEQMNTCALYKEEKTKFLSVCNEWYKVFKPHGLMDSRQRDMLKKWIFERQYANIDDSVVSMMIEICSIAKNEEKSDTTERNQP